jgi:DNA-binding response OmpR family regulator
MRILIAEDEGALVHRVRRKVEGAGVGIVTTRGLGYRIQKAGSA